MNACMHSWTHACVRTCVCACVRACMCACVRACIRVRARACTYACRHTCIHRIGSDLSLLSKNGSSFAVLGEVTRGATQPWLSGINAMLSFERAASNCTGELNSKQASLPPHHHCRSNDDWPFQEVTSKPALTSSLVIRSPPSFTEKPRDHLEK